MTPPAIGVIVKAVLLPAGLRTVNIELAAVVVTSDIPAICVLPLVRPTADLAISTTPEPESIPNINCPASVMLT